MSEKECFGECANVTVRYRSSSGEHYLYVDEQKLQECNACNLFARCMFLRYNDQFRDLLRLIDSGGKDTRPRIG